MINLISNELTKIFKKKGFYIVLIITLGFVILSNVMYKLQDNLMYSNIDNEIRFYEELLSNLDENSLEDKNEYKSYKVELDVLKLIKKYGNSDNTWQAKVIYDNVRELISEMNYYREEEKNEQEYMAVKAKYDSIVEKLDSGDWKYFAQKELEEVESNIKERQETKTQIVDKAQSSAIENDIYKLELKKQVLEWRLEKNICFGYDYKNQALANFESAKIGILEYENSNKKDDYDAKQNYYNNLEKAAISQYDIEHEVESANFSNARGILLDMFTEFEIFIIIMTVMIAGTIVSEEFNKGTIKLLLIKPYKRSTILLAKFITCIIILIITIISVALMQFVVGGIVQGFDSYKTPAIVYNHNTNQLEEIGLIKYLAVQTIGKLPIYILLMTLAFAVSTLLTNSAIGIVIALLGSMAAPMINMMAQQLNLKWIKYFVTPNWDLTQYWYGKLPAFEGLTLGFSILIIAIYMAIMLVTTFITFQKKNIKNV